jgi:peptide/nickel transport system substrate-binding protein
MKRAWQWLAAPALGVCLALAVAAPAVAQKSADTLRIVFRDGVPNVDPYYNNLRTGLILAHQGWDTLVFRDPVTFEIKPSLATEWKFVDATTIDFTLRPGVKFHDGSVMSADDVVYTISVACNPASKVTTPSNYNWIEKAEKTGDLSVRVTLKRPMPAALEYFALVIPIYPKAYREKVGGEGYAKAPIGAGPYRISTIEPGVSLTFERFDDYWAGSPKGKPAIKTMTVRFVPDAATEMTELLSGRADWIWNLNPDQFDAVNRLPNTQAIRKESMRIGYLSIDAAGRAGANSPVTNVKVRQAIWHAIDLKTIADKLVTGGSRVPAAPCFPTQFGCDESVATAYPYDPAKAKALLAEAGFANGFDVELASYTLPQWTAAVQSYLQAVGIRARISQLQVAAVVQRAQKGELALYMGSWGSYSINDVSAIMGNFFNGGNDDYARDPEVIKLLADAGGSNDAAARKAGYSAAIKRITEQAYWLPMHTYVSTYGFAKTLDFTPFADELPRFYLAKWK